MSKINTIWVIDDDQFYVFVLKKLITKNNLCSHILSFTNGEEAISHLGEVINSQESFPDLIILDINMPIMDGWEFLEEFINLKHLIEKDIPVYMVSSSINPIDIEKAKTYSEISDYILKPIKMDDLKRIMD